MVQGKANKNSSKMTNLDTSFTKICPESTGGKSHFKLDWIFVIIFFFLKQRYTSRSVHSIHIPHSHRWNNVINLATLLLLTELWFKAKKTGIPTNWQSYLPQSTQIQIQTSMKYGRLNRKKHQNRDQTQ